VNYFIACKGELVQEGSDNDNWTLWRICRSFAGHEE